MLTISLISGAGSSYYINDKADPGGYYLDGEAHTYWGGSAKDALGLNDGAIDASDFDRLMQGYVSDDGRIGNINKDGEWKHNPGRDFTLSNPKSVSILMQGPLRDDILQTIRRAVEKTMNYGEENFAKTRIKGELVGNQKTIWAAVNEETSRANDPNGHTHVVLFNILQGEDGKFRALDNPLYYKNQILLGQIYRAELAKGVKALGFEIEPVGKHGQWEIKEIPQNVREAFSKRRQAIVEKIDPNNDTAKARENICLLTRPNKQNIIKEKLLEGWDKELTALGTSFEALSKPNNPEKVMSPFKIDKQVKISMDIIAETRPYTHKHSLFREVMDRTDGHFTIDQIEKAVKAQIEKGYLTPSQDGGFLSRSKDLRREKQIVTELQKGHLNSKPLINEKTLLQGLEGTNLKDGQKAAIELFTRSNSTYVKVQGDAGTGKTTALTTAVPLIRQSGYKVIGLSTTNNSTEELEKTGVFDKVMTIQKYLLVPEGDKQTVLVVDESSMIGSDQMISLLNYTNKRKMPRVLFQGDAKQMKGVLAGEPFKGMETAGVRSVEMTEIIRQKDIRHRQAITDLSRANIKAAFKAFRPEIHEVSNSKMLEQAVIAWAATNKAHTPIIVQTNKQKNDINAAIKGQHLKTHANANSVNLKTWQRIYKTTPEKSLVRSYADASHIRFNRDYKRFRIKKGDIFKIEGLNEQVSEISLCKDGQQRKFNPAQYRFGEGAIELYKQEERTLHEGDRIRFTRGGHHQLVNNNELGEVRSIQNGKVTFDLDRNKTLTLSLKDKTIRHIDHAWASTAHAYQGKTVDNAVVLMPSRQSPLTSLDSLYTGTSRHRLSLTIVTDDADKLRTNIERKLNIDKMEANIRWPEVEARNERKLEDQKTVGQRKTRNNEARIELVKETEQHRDMSMGR